jgi:hypothetical protein
MKTVFHDQIIFSFIFSAGYFWSRTASQVSCRVKNKWELGNLGLPTSVHSRQLGEKLALTGKNGFERSFALFGS